MNVPEAPLERTDAGLAPGGEGWFVVNARDARWVSRPGRGLRLPLTGLSDEDEQRLFPQLGMSIFRLEPGEPIGVYHWEADAEGFLVLAGEALLIVEGTERPLGPWDFVHCPPGTEHMIVGAGDGPCLVLAAGSREHAGEDCNGGSYTVSEAALRHGVGVEEECGSGRAYEGYVDPEPAPYEDGWLPDR